MKRQAYLQHQKPRRIWPGQIWTHKIQNINAVVKKVDKEKVFYKKNKKPDMHLYPLVSFIEDFEWVDSVQNHT